jgi:hypothetical protein
MRGDAFFKRTTLRQQSQRQGQNEMILSLEYERNRTPSDYIILWATSESNARHQTLEEQLRNTHHH